MSNKLTNQPVTPSGEMLELLKDWVAPDVTESKKAEIGDRTNFLGVPIEQMYSKLEREEEVEEDEVPQLTAEEIEQIRQSAYEEGFAQGKEEGLVAGHQEGVEQGLEQGRETGHAEGLQQGLEQAQGEIAAQVQHWQQLIQQLSEPLARVDKAAEMQLLQLAVMLSESIVRQEIKSNPENLLPVLTEAVAALPFNTEYAELHLHPSDIELLQSIYDEEALAERKWILKSEPGYQPGDLIIATPNSVIDRTVKHRIKQTIDAFVESTGQNKEQIESPLPLTGQDDLAAQLQNDDLTDVETPETPEADLPEQTTDVDVQESATSENDSDAEPN